MSRQVAVDRSLRAYCRELESIFHRLRGAPGVVSPRDFGLMLEWFERKIPLAVVAEAMEEAFAGAGPDGIGTLAYLRRPVDRLFRHYREARLGTAEGGAATAVLGVQEVAAFLRRSLERVRAVHERFGGDSREMRLVVRGLERLLAPVAGTGDTGTTVLLDLEKMERALARLDRCLMAGILDRLDHGEQGRLRREAEAALAPYREVMSPSVLGGSVERRFHQELRRIMDLPELSLFTL